MAKNLVIPLKIETDLTDLQKIKDGLKGIADSSSKLVSETVKNNSTDILNLLNDAVDKYNQTTQSGKKNDQVERKFQNQFGAILKMAMETAKEAKQQMADITPDMYSDSAKEQLESLNHDLRTSKENLKQLSAVKIKNLDELFSPDKQSRLGIERFTALKAALDDLNRQQAKYEKLRDAPKRNKSEEEAFQSLKANLQLRLSAIKRIQEQKNASDSNAIAIKKESEAIKVLELAISKLTTEQKALISQSLGKDIDAILFGAKKFNTSKDVNDIGTEIQNLTGQLNIFDMFTKGASTTLVSFLTRAVSGVWIITTLKRTFKEVVEVITQLDQAFNEIAMVTTYTTKEVWKMKDSFVAIAKTTGLTLTEVTKLAGEFFRQGRSYSEVLKLTEAAGIAARVAGISASESVDYLTSAINGYKLSATQAMAVSDKFASLAASSATDYEELAIALSKVAAQAYSAGVGMDNMMGFIAKALETTREAPENIGTAFKTIFARMSELKDLGKTVEDGMDISRVDTALKQIGVSLTDQNGEIRELDTVLIEVGKKWKNLDKNQKAYIATALAGTRQQTRLLAVFEDFDRTMELADISANSLGASLAQQAKYQNSIAYAMNSLTVAWQKFISSLSNSDVITFFINILSGLVETLNGIIGSFSTMGPVLSTVTVITGILLGLIWKMVAVNKIHGLSVLAQTIAIEAQGVAEMINIGIKKLLTSATWLAIKANYEFAVSMIAANPPLAIATAAVVALVGVFVLLATAEERAAKKAEKFGEAMKKSQADLYNAKQKANDLQRLLDKYNEIEESIVKTNEDLKEQRDIAQQIQDLAGEVSVSFNGEIDTKTVEKIIAEQNKEAQKLIDDAMKDAERQYSTLNEAYQAAGEINDMATQNYILIGKILKDNNKTYEKYLEMNKEERDVLKEQAEVALQLDIQKKAVTKYAAAGQDTFTFGHTTLGGLYNTREEADAAAKAAGLNYVEAEPWTVTITLAEESQGFYEELKKIGFFDKGATTATKTKALDDFLKLDPKTKEAIKGMNSEIANLDTLRLKLLGESGSFLELSNILGNTQYTIKQISDISTALDSVGASADVLKVAIAEGPDAAVAAFSKSAEGNLMKTIQLSRQLSDVMSTVTFDSLGRSAKSLNSTAESLEKVNKILTGEEEYDIAFMQEMLITYPQLGEMISKGNELSISQVKTLSEKKKKAFLEDLDRQQASIQLQIDNNNLEIMLLQSMLKDTEFADVKKLELEGKTLTEKLVMYADYLENTENLNLASAKQQALDSLEMQKVSLDPSVYKERFDAINAVVTDSTVKGIVANTTNITGSMNEAEQRLNALLQNNKALQNQLVNISLIRSRIDKQGSLNAKNQNKAAEEYIAKLNEIYNLEQQIAFLQSEIDKYDFAQENAKSGKDWLIAIYSENAALEAQNELINKTIDAQKAQQGNLYNSLSAQAKAAVTIVNGRMIAVMGKYNNLSKEQQEAVDAAAESYNDLSDSINDNSQSLSENTAEIEANLQKIEDKKVEFYDILKEAIIAEENEKLQILKDGLEEERKLLEKRKKMYEDAFSETDYLDALKETTDKRAKVIEELAALEGANDLNSQKRRQELLKEKAELDKEYNTTTVDYNKDALFETIDEQQKIIDETEAKYEAAYEARVTSVAWMEARIQEIIQSGDEATIQYLKDNLPEYEDAWTMSRDNIEREWRFLYGVVDETIQNIENSIPDFSGMIAQLTQAAGLIGQINGGLGNYPNTPPSGNGKITYSWIDAKRNFVSNGVAYKVEEEWKLIDGNQVSKTGKTRNIPLGRTINKDTTSNKVGASGLGAATLQAYASGGLADFTGPAWLDGTKSRPERILDPVQTHLFDRMVEYLGQISNPTMTTAPVSPIATGNASVSIGNVQIAVNGLQTDDDFTKVGNAFGDQLKAAIKERGLNINKKR